MTSFVSFIRNPKDTFKSLKKVEEKVLSKRSNYLFFLLGALIGFNVLLRDHFDIFSSYSVFYIALIICLAVLFGGILYAFICNVFSAIFFLIGKKMGGLATKGDLKITFAYSHLPIIFIELIRFGVHFYDPILGNYATLILAFRILAIILRVWQLIILLTGVQYYQKYNLKSVLITISPYIIFGLVFSLFDL